MKSSINKMLGLLGLLVLATFSHGGWAISSCKFTGETSTKSIVVPLNPPAISAGVDMPIGTIIYQGRWTNAPMQVVVCTSSDGTPILYNWAVNIVQAPLSLSGLNTGLFAGSVYQTNIPGIGVAISRYNNSAPTKLGSPGYRNEDISTPSGVGNNLNESSRYISLVKIGPLTPGNYSLSAASLPTVSDDMINPRSGAPSQGLPLRLTNVTFQGTLTISAQTCTTPNVNVAMGSYDIRDNFKRINSTTPWIDASISLTNCPTFRGFYNETRNTLLMDFNTGAGIVSISINNSIGVRLMPTTEVKDAANGVMAIDSTVSGAASGVGIQIGWGDTNNTPTPFNFSAEQSVTLPKDGSATVRVPLAARYIQTAERPMPGKANGKVTFTINYY